MTEPKDGPWRGNPQYLYKKTPLTEGITPIHEFTSGTLVFPRQFDWANPGPEQQAWSERILRHVPEAYFDIFQEYGLVRKDGEVTRYDDHDASTKIGLALSVSGRGNSANYSSLYPVFGNEFAEYFNDLRDDRWKMFLYAKNTRDLKATTVYGGGRMHVCDMGRTYWNGLRVDFDDVGEARIFLDTVKEHPRPGLELYLRTLFGDAFPRNHYDGRKMTSADRFEFYPFDETHGPLEIATKDLTVDPVAR